MSFFSSMEEIIKRQGEQGLVNLEHYYGLDLELRRASNGDVYDRVYKRNSGAPTEHVKNFIGLVQGDDFLPNNNAYSGNFESGFLYTQEKGIKAGDVIRIKSDDGKARNFKVDEKQSIGMTMEIFTQWLLTSIGN